MTNDEAKAAYNEAVNQFNSGDHAGALASFDALDQERPNSRHVTFHRALCLAGLGRVEEAEQCLQRLDGKIDAPALQQARNLITQARAARKASSPGLDSLPAAVHENAPATPPPPAVPAEEERGNLLAIQSVYPVSNEECTILAFVQSGVFHAGDNLMVVSPGGASAQAPILRIGTSEMPVNLVRAGQKVSMLLKIDPTLVAPGASATCAPREELYAATMVVSANRPKEVVSTSEMTPELLVVERMIKRGEFGDAERLLNVHLLQNPGHYSAHRMLAQIYLEASAPLNNLKLAAEHIQTAYEKGGANDPSVIHLLADTLARNGDAEQGLRFMERLYAATIEPDSRNALAQRIYDFRGHNNLGHVWQFADAYGEVIFEATDAAEVIKALVKEAVPRNARCRRDRVGEWQTIPTLLAPEFPEVASIYGLQGANKRNLAMPIIIGVLVVAILLVLVIGMMR